jgi:hypothetical protein
MDNRLLQAAQTAPQQSEMKRLWPDQYTAPPASAGGHNVNYVGDAEGNYAWLRQLLAGDIDPATQARVEQMLGIAGGGLAGTGAMIAGQALKNNPLQHSWNPLARAAGLAGRGVGHAAQWIGTPAAIAAGIMIPEERKKQRDLEGLR